MHLMSDRRARHYWDEDRRIGSLFRTLRLDDDKLRMSAAAWDTYLLFDRDARWQADSLPPEPAWWEHQLPGLPPERRLDPARFGSKAAALSRDASAASRR
jgi:hypothetical protein